MSKIDELIAKLCPEGVNYKELGDFINYQQPTKFIVKSTQYDDNNVIPVLTAGQSFILGYTNENEGIYSASKETAVIIFDDFTTSFHWVDFAFKVKSSAMKILTIKGDVEANFRYLFYAMKCIGFKPQDHARHWISIYSKFQIPIPPLPVQEEIVRILDKFTALEAELEAELEARTRQYEYYRNELLAFEGKDVEWKTLGEIFNLKNGYTPSTKNKEYWTDGSIPWFRMEDIRENGKILSKSIQKINSKGVKSGKLFPANSILVATSATIGEHALITIPHLSNQRFTSLSLKENFISKINMKFIFYYCFVLDEWCKKNITTSSFASVDMVGFKKFKIPVPPIEEQERIVAILDQFDALVNDIATGLPAEIQARRQQYEYYRGKLLTFEPVAVAQ